MAGSGYNGSGSSGCPPARVHIRFARLVTCRQGIGGPKNCRDSETDNLEAPLWCALIYLSGIAGRRLNVLLVGSTIIPTDSSAVTPNSGSVPGAAKITRPAVVQSHTAEKVPPGPTNRNADNSRCAFQFFLRSLKRKVGFAALSRWIVASFAKAPVAREALKRNNHGSASFAV